MGTKVFGSSTATPEVFRAGDAVVTVGSPTSNQSKLYAIGAQLRFGRQAQVLPTLGSGTHVSVSEPQGAFTASAILTKSLEALQALGMGDAGCKAFQMTISFKGGDCQPSGVSYTAYGCVSTQLTVDAQGDRGYVGQNVEITFTGLEVNGARG